MSTPENPIEAAKTMTTDDVDWRRSWDHRFTDTPNPSWWRNRRLRGISLKGTAFLGIDETTNRLHWNGEELQTRQSIRLEGATFGLPVAATMSAIILAVIEVGRAASWWP